jgi:NitT/TauT family transport system substrate-binding protein
VIEPGRRRALAILGGTAAAFGFFAAAGSAVPLAESEPPAVRIGILKYGTVSWTLDVVARYGLDRAEGVRIEKVELASSQATQVALQAGRVDTVVSDLLWVARQRASGADWAFVPYSTALGAVEVPADSPIQSFDDLAGHRLGVAGTPLDKSWLLLRLLSLRRTGRDLDTLVEKNFGAPPLLAEQLAAGRLDAVLTYWQFAARLEATGARRLLGMDDAMRQLGIAGPVPLVGYVVSDRWAAANAAVFAGFLRACRRAEEILSASDDDWQLIASLTGAASVAELERLRDAFRGGVPKGQPDHHDAERLYELLATIGGEMLIGPSPALPPGTFLDGFGF